MGFALWPIAEVPLVVCLLLGAVVATTDPAAVIAIFRDVGAPARLTRLVEGEALLNDAAAISLFRRTARDDPERTTTECPRGAAGVHRLLRRRWSGRFFCGPPPTLDHLTNWRRPLGRGYADARFCLSGIYRRGTSVSRVGSGSVLGGGTDVDCHRAGPDRPGKLDFLARNLGTNRILGTLFDLYLGVYSRATTARRFRSSRPVPAARIDSGRERSAFFLAVCAPAAA